MKDAIAQALLALLDAQLRQRAYLTGPEVENLEAARVKLADKLAERGKKKAKSE